MNRNVIIAVVALVVIAGAGWFFTKGGSSAHSGVMSMREILASGVTEKCDYTEPNSGTQGTVYVAGHKVRADFTSSMRAGTSTQKINGHMITDGTTVQTWMDGIAQGFKMTLSASTSAEQNPKQGLNPDQKGNYTCQHWSADPSLFTAPTNITFIDPAAMMQPKPGTPLPINPATATCSICEQAPSAQAKSICKQQLHCQ